MSTSGFTFRMFLILSVLTVFNMMFLGFFLTKNYYGRLCTVDNIINSVSKFINDNGRLTLDQELSESCRKSEPKGITKEALLSAILNVVDVCKKTKKRVFPKTLTSPITTLFTTLPNGTSQEKRSIHNITLRNWIRFKPKVNVVVFVNDTESIDFVKSLGITTLPILHSAAGGAPVLKTMFKTAQKLQPSSHLYGYVNSDIIFTNKLLETLELLLQSRINTSEPMLMVGRRVNVLNISYKETLTDIDIEQIAKTRGTLFIADAEDYFFTNSAYPWKDIADVVVGRLAYDNWLVGHTICNLNIDVIELTDSVLAVHQTTDSGGNFEGFRHEHANYNNLLFKQLEIVPKFELGSTICAKKYTYIDLCGNIGLTNRTDVWCACPNTTVTAKNTP